MLKREQSSLSLGEVFTCGKRGMNWLSIVIAILIILLVIYLIKVEYLGG